MINTTEVKAKLKELEVELDEEFGKMGRLLSLNWYAKPAWFRYFCVAMFGLVTGLALR
jgi:hypothetical protein